MLRSRSPGKSSSGGNHSGLSQHLTFSFFRMPITMWFTSRWNDGLSSRSQTTAWNIAGERVASSPLFLRFSTYVFWNTFVYITRELDEYSLLTIHTKNPLIFAGRCHSFVKSAHTPGIT